MSATVCRPAPPYSLHDSNLIAMEAEGDKLTLRFQYGIIKLSQPSRQADVYIEITGVRWKECCAYLMEYQGVLCGNFGPFTGRKLPLTEFIAECRPMGLSIMTEGYSDVTMNFSGFRTARNTCYEFFVEISYAGEIIFHEKE